MKCRALARERSDGSTAIVAVSARSPGLPPAATINATPSATACTLPNESTVATPPSRLLQVIVRVGPIAERRIVSPGTSVARAGDTITLGAYPEDGAVGPLLQA